MKKSKIVALVIAGILGIFGLSMVPATTNAASSVCDQLKADNTTSQEVLKANGCSGAGDSAEFSGVIVGIINGIVGVLGIVAAIFIVVGGVNYMTSQGDPGKTKKAKDTILYATIGLIIAALAFAIVNFVVVNILKDTGSNSSPDEVTIEVVPDN